MSNPPLNNNNNFWFQPFKQEYLPSQVVSHSEKSELHNIDEVAS